MPHDDFASIKEALLQARGNNTNENPVFYRKILCVIKSTSFCISCRN